MQQSIKISALDSVEIWQSLSPLGEQVHIKSEKS